MVAGAFGKIVPSAGPNAYTRHFGLACLTFDISNLYGISESSFSP
jgi:hypothetical protein